MVATESYLLFQLAEERHCNVATILTGLSLPIYQSEFQLYKTYKLVQARLEQQQQKGI